MEREGDEGVVTVQYRDHGPHCCDAPVWVVSLDGEPVEIAGSREEAAETARDLVRSFGAEFDADSSDYGPEDTP